MRLQAALALLSVVSVGAAPARADAPPTAADAAARADHLWKRRDDAAALAQQKAVLEQALAAAPGDYGLLWRLARWYAWRAGDERLPKDERVKLGKTGWDLGERAVAANPDRVEGQYWAMAGMGNYALGLGILRALTQGIEGKFKERLGRAERADGGYEYGAIAVAWGGYWGKLPWPKYDEKKATASFRKALAINPDNLRARVFWAELHVKEDRKEEARKLLEEVVKATPGKYDAPEERRCQGLAAAALERLNRGGK